MARLSIKKQKVHYAWFILLACCLIQGAGLGIVNNCVGLFYVPICNDLGFSRGDIALYVTFQNLSCCFGMLCAKPILGKFKLRDILAVASLLAGVPYFLLSRATQLWHWYILGVTQGLGLAFITSLVVPIVLRQWFSKRLGLAMGAASSFAGLTGAVMSAVLGVVIRDLHWRMGYTLSGVVLLVMTLPVSLFVMRMNPEEKGLQPYGYEDSPNDVKAVAASAAAKKPFPVQIIEIILLGFLAKAFCSFISHLPAYGSVVPVTIVEASLLTTFCMLGNMATKLAFGPLNDRVGSRWASDIAIGVIAVAILLLLSKGQLAMCIGAFLFGTVAMFSVTEVPLIARSIWNKAHYADAMVAINVASYLSYSFTMSIYGYLYDFWGQYDIIFVILLGLLVVEWILIHLLIRKNASEIL